VVAVVAMAEVGRPARFLNLLLAVWLVGGPWFLGGAVIGGQVNSAATGLGIIMLSLPLGRRRDHHAFDRAVQWAPVTPR
jgi:hypothetical protein